MFSELTRVDKLAPPGNNDWLHWAYNRMTAPESEQIEEMKFYFPIACKISGITLSETELDNFIRDYVRKKRAEYAVQGILKEP